MGSPTARTKESAITGEVSEVGMVQWSPSWNLPSVQHEVHQEILAAEDTAERSTNDYADDHVDHRKEAFLFTRVNRCSYL